MKYIYELDLDTETVDRLITLIQEDLENGEPTEKLHCVLAALMDADEVRLTLF